MKNAGFRHGIFFYNRAIDEPFSHLSTAAAYNAKSGFIQRTSDDLRAYLRRRPLHDVACITSHVYEFSNSVRQDGSSKQPHIHTLWWQRNFSTGTSKVLNDFFSSRKFRGQWTSARCTFPWGCGSIYIKEGDAGYTKKMWKYSLQGNQMRLSIRLRTSAATVLDIQIPINPDGVLLKMIRNEVRQFLAQQLPEQQVVRQRYALEEDSQTSPSNPDKQMYDRFDNG